MDDILRELGAPFLEESHVLLPVPQVVWEHHGNLIDYGVIPAALGTGEHAINNCIPVHFEFQQLKRIVLVDGAGENV